MDGRTSQVSKQWRATMPFCGDERGSDIVPKVTRLVGEETKTNDKTEITAKPKDVINFLYSVLNILDAKANGLLRVNSLFITILVFFIGWSNSPGFPAARLTTFKPIAYLGLVLLLISSLFCLLVVRIQWKFLGRIAHDGSFEKEIGNLCKVVDDRTHYYWLAWFVTLATLIISTVWSFGILASRWAKSSGFLT